MAVNAGQLEMLETYLRVFNFLLRTYATDDVVAEAHTYISTFPQNSNITEKSHSDHLWNRALPCGSVFSDRWLMFLFFRKTPSHNVLSET